MLFDKFAARSLQLANHMVMAPNDTQPGDAPAHARSIDGHLLRPTCDGGADYYGLAQSQRPRLPAKYKSYAERVVVINKTAALLHAEVDGFARLKTLEIGKRIDEARGEVAARSIPSAREHCSR